MIKSNSILHLREDLIRLKDKLPSLIKLSSKDKIWNSYYPYTLDDVIDFIDNQDKNLSRKTILVNEDILINDLCIGKTITFNFYDKKDEHRIRCKVSTIQRKSKLKRFKCYLSENIGELGIIRYK